MMAFTTDPFEKSVAVDDKMKPPETYYNFSNAFNSSGRFYVTCSSYLLFILPIDLIITSLNKM